MGYQTAETAFSLGDALAAALDGRRALLVASTDLSHYHDAATAEALDTVVIDCVSQLDADGCSARSTTGRPRLRRRSDGRRHARGPTTRRARRRRLELRGFG